MAGIMVGGTFARKGRVRDRLMPYGAPLGSGMDIGTGIADRWSAGWRRALLFADIALPPLCLGCGRGVDAHGALCARCWSEIEFIERPFCAVTGLPFSFDTGPDTVSAVALAQPPAYARARAAMRYNDRAAALLHRFKYGDRMEAAPAFARWLVRSGAELLADADLLAPVPLHERRLFSRRFNQSAELSRRVAASTGVVHMPELLQRVRATRPQVGLSGDARRRNVAGAFRLANGADALVRGRRVVLVDDVMTTGATAEACARVLRRGGAAEVSVLCVARVVPGGGVSI
ncbi:MAG: ComF family protein [Parvibaculum sp.]|uniref:ComF family protein n=1 Tax=Parvibaculum sp. TaxID=2024848 RepID=UPI0032ED4069